VSRSDLTIDGQDYMLLRVGRGRGAAGSEVPEVATEQFVREDVPLEQDDWSKGGFYSQRSIQGGYDYAKNAWALNPRCVMPGPEMNAVTLSSATGVLRAAVEENGDLYLVGGTCAYRVTAGTAGSTTLSVHKNFKSSNLAVSAVQFLGDGYVGTVNSSNENSDLWKVSGTTWSTGAANHGYLVTTFYSTATGASPRWLAGQSSNSKVDFAAADPLVGGNWGAEVSVREAGSVRINGLVSRTDHTYISTDRGLFDFDGGTGNTVNLTPQIEKYLDNDNGIATLAHNGWIYYGHRRGLLRVQAFGQDDGRTQDVTPGYGTSSDNPVRGKVTALASWGPWVLAAVYNGTDTYINFGRERHEDEAAIGPSPMLWHPGVIYLPSATCYLLYLSGLTTPPTLWVGRNNNVSWCYLPRTENPLQDSEYRFATTYSFFTSNYDWGLPAVQKDISQWNGQVDNAGTGTSMAVNISADGGGFGLFGTARTSPRSTLAPSGTTRGTRFKERWDATGTNTAGPVVRGHAPRADLLVRARDRRRYSIRLAEWDQDHAGGRLPTDVGKTLRRLKALPDKGPLIMRDEFGDTLTVRVHRPVDYQEIEVAVDDRRKARVLVVPLEVSVLRRTGSGFTWGDGTKWDGSKQWS
jgi:hypothetical protein